MLILYLTGLVLARCISLRKDYNRALDYLSSVGCLNECGKNLGYSISPGVCFDGICLCRSGYYGADCSFLTTKDNVNKKSDGNFLPSAQDTCDEYECNALCKFGGSCLSNEACVCNIAFDENDNTIIDAIEEVKDDSSIVGTINVKLQSSILREFLVLLNYGSLIPKDPCDLKEILCNGAGYVTSIELMRKKLSGIISPKIGYFASLETLDLSYNEIQGSIPDTIGRLHKLRNLIINRNQLSGPIPQSIGKCESLDIVSLYNNNFSDVIPDSISKLGRLRYLDLSYNSLSGEVPPISNMMSLETLYLNDNNLSGQASDIEIDASINLRYIKLSNNPKLLGEIKTISNPLFKDSSDNLKFEGNVGNVI